eukprot:6195461-Pleurochrysis_carterae.AAC.3
MQSERICLSSEFPIARNFALFSLSSDSAPGSGDLWVAAHSNLAWFNSSRRSSWIVGSSDRTEKWAGSSAASEQPGPESSRSGWNAMMSTSGWA